MAPALGEQLSQMVAGGAALFWFGVFLPIEGPLARRAAWTNSQR
jgi:hypothetical protein